LLEIRGTAESAIEEFEKVTRLKQHTATQTRQVETQTREILSAVHRQRFDHIDHFVRSLADLRSIRGDIISLRDLRYVDEPLVQRLDSQLRAIELRIGHGGDTPASE